MQNLIDAVLAWWEQHKYDTFTDCDSESYNEYDTPPDFVKIAYRLKFGKEMVDN